MYLIDGDVVLSASDLTAAATCELAFLRGLDVRLGRIEALDVAEDPMLARTASLGEAHELRLLAAYEERFGPARDAADARGVGDLRPDDDGGRGDGGRAGGVVQVERPSLRDPEAVAAALAATRSAFESGADVVYQAMLAEPPSTAADGERRPGFVGFADFVVRQADGRCRIQDSKLARHARVTALLQLAAYAGRLRVLGVAVDDDVDLVLGDGTVSTHRLVDVEPVYRLRRAHLERLVTAHLAHDDAARWGDPGVSACGRCAVCDAEVTAHRDVLLVAGLRLTQRARLAAAGITTIEQLAASSGPVDGIGTSTLAGLREQAALQLESEALPPPPAVDPPPVVELPPVVEPVETTPPQTAPLPVVEPVETTPPDRSGVVSTGSTTGDSPAVVVSTSSTTGVGSDRSGVVSTVSTTGRVSTGSPTGVGTAVPAVRVVDPDGLAVIPAASDGDIFFDFEGDPLYTEGAGTQWGLDYLFGLVEVDGTFRAWWAHSFAEERVALRGFLDYLRDRRRTYPDLHVYHYASYERTHLLALAARHGVGEEEIDQLLREHVLVDLYPIVRRSVRVGSRSYSIKKLEPLYMGDDLRSGDVQTAGASIEEYAAARAASARGDVVQGEKMLAAIADYNAYDCRSTLRLRDWLAGLARERRVEPLPVPDDAPGREVEASPLAERIAALAGDPLDPDRTPDERALGLAAAAIDYHRRENKSFWWGHFARLIEPPADWLDTRDVLRVDSVRLVRDWTVEGRQKNPRRVIELRGEWAPGSRPSTFANPGPHLLYEPPGPYPSPTADPGARSVHAVRVLEVVDDATVLVEEALPGGHEPHQDVPIALAPAAPPDTRPLAAAVAEWATRLVDPPPPMVEPVETRTPVVEPVETTPPDRSGVVSTGSTTGRDTVRWPRDAVVDILRRTPPRSRSGRGLAAVRPGDDGEGDHIAAVVASVLDLDDSYLAVQGPPGTGKTYLAARVIRTLVERHHWRVGVVAQSHAVVENVLDGVVGAGLDRDLVGKQPGDPEADLVFTAVPRKGYAAFADERATSGFVLGGTAWDFVAADRVPRRSLDLLVVDEAGQYSLGTTIAASVAARNLLLLGDPQQLPQVSQGTHPEPVDTSALGWVSAGHDVLPAELGYFLAASRRMHPAVSRPVSDLSYEGRLHSHPCAAQRSLDDVEPGLHVHPVPHEGRSTESPEEAAEVVRIVRSLLGKRWSTAPDDAGRSLTAADVVVVTPYNAQVQRVRQALDAAGLGDARVGTVDKFQGQEAVVAIVSLAASDAVAVPRGMEFLLMKNRLNVAISRAQWAAYLVWSPALLDHLPPTPPTLAQLSAFARLVGA
ncbi:Superfamily I DNA and RNA helicase and helicase subunits-like protein [Xylanimonas cellulosilytica DSM 15894]|uniref:Superfamily I DNA and RNA helicase and helicase subunits-like protein n=1 Tax=Xylanimonas cellulosilytica (strain DSM 15894 / JCM 12276 / CECT 5975 / KCTC 9989 / LMG 20990 / NBRC 107835 / XIL07) TaxID=446471 RepID=D1BTZ4_XYLCX|nr:bifunctional RecB family nuclease/DEAD/DEAH box helicase [Xylanimonas cellulosilytica]ACZ29158.1 Superfamily I DNA and RNA helicase and helicase subunits-like protein [Xylanimonas cellulosilytica DSM 15894]